MFNELNFEEEHGQSWNFLLDKKEDELIFLFPFWRYMEYICVNNYSFFQNIAGNTESEIQYLREFIVVNLGIAILDLVKSEPPSIYRTPCLMGIIPVTRSYDEQQQLHKRI